MPTVSGKAYDVTRLNARMDVAVRGVLLAQHELTLAVNALAPVLVGDNQLITPWLERCLEKVRTAQHEVVALRQLLGRV